MSKVVVVSHGDCDGVCSVAVVLKKYPTARVIFTHPHGLEPILKWRELKNADRIFILDLAFHSKLMESLIELSNSSEIVYIDHHPSSLELVGKLDNVFVDVNFSTSELVCIYLQIPSILGHIGAIGDKILMVSRSYYLFHEAELLRKSLTFDPNDDNFRLSLVHELSNDKLPSQIPEVIDRANISEKIVKFILKHIDEFIIYNGDFMVVDATRIPEIAGRVGVVATKLTIEHGKPVFIISRFNNKYVLTGRCSYENGLNMDELMRQFGGGGHKFAASARVSEDQYHNLISLLTNLVGRYKYDTKNVNGVTMP